jgi:hypothetical protein
MPVIPPTLPSACSRTEAMAGLFHMYVMATIRPRGLEGGRTGEFARDRKARIGESYRTGACSFSSSNQVRMMLI